MNPIMQAETPPTKFGFVVRVVRGGLVEGLSLLQIAILFGLLQRHPRAMTTAELTEATGVPRKTLQDNLNAPNGSKSVRQAALKISRYLKITHSEGRQSIYSLNDDGVRFCTRLLRNLSEP